MADIIDFNEYARNRAEPDIEEELECEPSQYSKMADMLMLLHNNRRALICDRKFLRELERRLETVQGLVSMAAALLDEWGRS